MFGDGHSRRYSGSSDRQPPSIGEEFSDLVGSMGQDSQSPISSLDYYLLTSGHSSLYTTQGGYSPPQLQQPYAYPVQHQSDHYQQQQQQQLREPRDERQTNPRESHSYHVHSLTQVKLVHKRSSRKDSFRLRPRKAEPGDPTRKYTCDECDGCFDTPRALNTHKLSHSGEKPFRCSYFGCGKGFTSMSNKTRHEKTHCATSAFEVADQNGSSSSSSSRRQKGNSYCHYIYSSRGS